MCEEQDAQAECYSTRLRNSFIKAWGVHPIGPRLVHEEIFIPTVSTLTLLSIAFIVNIRVGASDLVVDIFDRQCTILVYSIFGWWSPFDYFRAYNLFVGVAWLFSPHLHFQVRPCSGVTFQINRHVWPGSVLDNGLFLWTLRGRHRCLGGFPRTCLRDTFLLTVTSINLEYSIKKEPILTTRKIIFQYMNLNTPYNTQSYHLKTWP